jgi:hypothetical protein
MNPTQLELATLAARLPSGTPYERVETALSIWHAAQDRIDWEEEIELHREEFQQFDREPTRPLLSVLAEVMPGKTATDRMKFWRDFISTDPLCIFDPYISEEENERRLESMLETHRQEGVQYPTYLSTRFKMWHQKTSAEMRKSRAAKAAKARHDKPPNEAPDPDEATIPQVPKKSLRTQKKTPKMI